MATTPQTISGWSRQSGVIGSVAAITSLSEPLVIEACTDATIFVTASFTSLTARGLVRCTLVAAPCAESVALEDCVDCVFSVAAPRVSAADVPGCALFAAAAAPILVAGARSRDVRLGPYNVVGDALLTGTALGAWAAAGGDAACRLDARSEAASTRTLAPADFYWRFLPVPQTRPERLALPPAFAAVDATVPAVAEGLLAGLRGANAQRAETLAQSKFVLWMLQDGGKANALKHVRGRACGRAARAPANNLATPPTPFPAQVYRPT
jgi:hypothetical protein